MRSIQRLFFLGMCVAALCAAGGKVNAATKMQAADRLERFRQFFLDFQTAPDSGIPGDLLADCHGVIIMRQYKAGFIIGARGGDGVIFLHDKDTGGWSAPAFVRSAEGSFGFQIGGQAIDAIILIMNHNGVDMLLKTRFNIGVDASAAVGPVGRDASMKVGPGTALLAYSRARGLYAGAVFEGGTILNHDNLNRAMYGMNVGLGDILIDRAVPVPAEAYPMIEALQSYAVRSSVQPEAAAVLEPAIIEPSTPHAGYAAGYPADYSELDAAAAEAAEAARAAQAAAAAAQAVADTAAARAAAARTQ